MRPCMYNRLVCRDGDKLCCYLDSDFCEVRRSMAMEYRVVNHRRTSTTGGVESWYQVEEVYFSPDDHPTYYSPASAAGSTLREANIDAQLILEAFNKDVLFFNDDTGLFVVN